MRRTFLIASAAAVSVLSATSVAHASPVAAKLFNQGAQRIATSLSVHAEVQLPSQQLLVIDHVATGGQRVERFLGGELLRTDALLWQGTLIAGQAPRLTGVFQLRAGQPCWKAFGFSAPYRMETHPFGALQTEHERENMMPPRLHRREVRRAKRSPRGVIRLKAQRGQVTATMDVSASDGQPLALSVDQSQITARFSFPARWSPAPPADSC